MSRIVVLGKANNTLGRNATWELSTALLVDIVGTFGYLVWTRLGTLFRDMYHTSGSEVVWLPQVLLRLPAVLGISARNSLYCSKPIPLLDGDMYMSEKQEKNMN